jgi:hypothetical protein
LKGFQPFADWIQETLERARLRTVLTFVTGCTQLPEIGALGNALRSECLQLLPVLNGEHFWTTLASEQASAPRFIPGTVPGMTTMREVPIEPDLLELATGLGFTPPNDTDCCFWAHLCEARWKGSPVGIAHITGPGGHLGVAFYQGRVAPTPEEIAGGGRFIAMRWDEVIDTGWADEAALLVIAKAMLNFRAAGRENLYRGTAMPDIPAGS